MIHVDTSGAAFALIFAVDVMRSDDHPEPGLYV